MTIDRNKWNNKIQLEHFSLFKCPSCNLGFIKFDKNRISAKRAARSYKWEQEEENYFPPDIYEARFSAVFDCTNTKCKETFHITGMSEVSEDYEIGKNGQPEITYITYYTPIVFNPPPLIISLAKIYPKQIINDIEIISKLYWMDLGSCGNSIRICLENILDILKIPRYNNKRNRINLHQRINELNKRATKFSHLVEYLTAVKWIGNDASHNRELQSDDIFDAIDLIEYVLEEIFSNRKSELNKISKLSNVRLN